MKFFKPAKERLLSLCGALIRFWAVFLLLVGTAVFIGVSINKGGNYSRQISALIFTAFAMLLAQLAAERFGGNILTRSLIMTGGALLGAAYFAWLPGSAEMGEPAYVTTYTLCFALLFAALFIQAWRRETPFSSIFLNFFKALYTSVFFSGVIYAGLVLIILAIDNLLFRVDGDIYAHLANIVWVIWAPMLMLSLLPAFADRGEDRGKIARATSYPRFFEVLLLYVLTPLAAAYTLVLVLYMIRTVVTSGWRNNLLDPLILSYLISMILLNVLIRGIDKPLSVLFRRISPGFITAIAIFGVVSSLFTVSREGVVAGRYYVLLFGLYSAVTGALMLALPRRRYDYVASLAVVFALICTLPALGAYDVSAASQSRVVTRTLEKYGMISDGEIVAGRTPDYDDGQLIYYGVAYLQRIGELERLKFLPDNFKLYGSDNDFNTVFGFYPFENGPQGVKDYHSYELGGDSIRTRGYDYLVSARYDHTMYGDEEKNVGRVTHDGIEYNLKIRSDDAGGTLRLTSGEEVLLEMDLTEALGTIGGYTEVDGQLPAAMLTFDAGNGRGELRVIFTRIEMYEYQSRSIVYAELTILFNIK